MSKAALGVIGGGIAGMTTALFCARKGYSVSLFEKHRLGSGATTAAAGVLSPPSFLDRSRPDHSQNSYALLSEKSYRFYPEFIDLLEGYSMFETGFDRCGTWHLAATEEQREQYRSYYHEMLRYDREVEWADGAGLRNQFDRLSEHVRGGYFFAEEAQVHPGRLTQSLRDALNSEEISIHEKEPVHSLRCPDPHAPWEITTEKETYSTVEVVIAAGCWSASFSSEIEQDIRVEPRKGQMIKLRENMGKGPMFESSEIHVVPRMDGTVDVGATVEDTGFDTEVTREARKHLLSTVRRLFPDFSTRKVIDQWAGLRPYARRKGGPFLGDVPDQPGLYVNTGHYQKGILQAPYTGYLLSQHISGESTELDLERYSVDR